MLNPPQTRNWLLIFVAYAFGLWWHSVLLTGDEKVYISTALEMWQRGAWLNPYLFGETSYLKPPFQFWMTVLGWKTFGFGPFGTYIPSVLAMLGTAVCLDGISRELRPGRVSLAGIWFAATAGTMTYALSAQMEIWIVLFYSASWWAALCFLRTNRVIWLFIALAIAGLASLVKSPLYSALWVLGFWIYLLTTNRAEEFKRARLYISHFLGVALGLSWFAWVLHSDGDRFWAQYVVTETLSKKSGNSSTISHMWGDFSTFLFPALLLVFPAMLKAWSDHDAGSLRKFIFAWAILPILFFDLFPYRTETYLYILVPVFALILDFGVRDGTTTWFVRANAVLVSIVLVLASFLLASSGMLPLWLALTLSLIGIAQAALSWDAKASNVARSLLGTIFAIHLGLLSLGESDFSGLREYISKNPDKKLAMLNDGRNIWHESGMVSVAVKRPLLVIYNSSEITQRVQEGYAVILHPDQAERIGLTGSSFDWWRWRRAFQVPSIEDLRNLGKARDDAWKSVHQKRYQIYSQ